jgi:hypothetical protein
VADDALGAIGRGAPTVADDVLGGAARVGGTAAKVAATPADEIAASVLGSGATAATVGAEAAGMTGAARAGLFANVTKASLLKGAGVAGTGYMVSGMFDNMNIGGENSTVDRAGSGAILGAGLAGGGAIAMGLGTGPAGWAALGGAALYGGYKALWGDKTTTPEKMQTTIDDTRETILQVGQMYGLDATALDDVLLQYETSTGLYMNNGDKEGLKAYMAGLGATLPAMMLQEKEQAKMEKQEEDRYNRMIQTQASFAPIFESQITRASQASETAMQAADQTAGYLQQSNPNLASLVRQSAAQSNESANRLYAAYAQQMALAPQQAANTYDLQNQLAQQELLSAQYGSPVA